MVRRLTWTTLIVIAGTLVPGLAVGGTGFTTPGSTASTPGVLSRGTMGLRWDAVVGAAGYRVYYGMQPGHYTWSIDVGKKTTASIDGLKECTTYFAAVKAYNAVGESPLFSNEITGWARPTVLENDTTLMMQGGQYVVNLAGHGFSNDAQLEFGVTDIEGQPLVRVESLNVYSCTVAQALLSVEPSSAGARAMQIGTHSFRVVNPDGAVFASDYEVELNPTRLDINRSEPDTRERVNGKDLVWLSFSHGAGEGEARYSPDADLTGDGFVDGEDLAWLASVFGACWDGAVWDPTACR